MPNTHHSQANLKALRDQINAELLRASERNSAHMVMMGPELEVSAQALTRFVVDSGKRLRPLFSLLGVISAGHEITESHIKASAALEYLHVCALIHDDLMDASDTRRGAPSIHKYFEQHHQDESLEGSASLYGLSAAILLGDLALVFSDKALHESGISTASLIRAIKVFDDMRIELMAGQFLDVHEQTLKHRSRERALRIATYKSGKYSIERPLHFGVAMVEEDSRQETLNEVLSSYGIPLGQAFQLRDDLLGVFGDPAQTGKPAGDDLREGKRTLLVAQALNSLEEGPHSNKEAHDYLEARLGNRELSNEEIDRMREIIVSSGAQQNVEETIKQLSDRASSALEHHSISDSGKLALEEMVTMVTVRNA